MSKNLFCLCAFTLTLMTFTIGCGADINHEGLKVQGNITLDGEPIQTGAIAFIPIGKGIAAGATISQGQYLVESTKGPIAGEYKVEIDSTQPTGKKIPDSVGNGSSDEYANIIPEIYNRKTELKVIIEQDRDNKHNFALFSKK